MKAETFEMSGSAPKQPQMIPADPGTFDWTKFFPVWLEKAQSSSELTDEHRADIAEHEEQMNLIAEFAREQGIDFRSGTVVEADHSGTELLLQEGMTSADHAEFNRNTEDVRVKEANSPLVRMINWGQEQGIITNKEADQLREFYKPG